MGARRFPNILQVRFSQQTVEDMDAIIKEDVYDDRSQFIRYAVNKYIRELKNRPK
jgi:metal-responsive CopG/Arc/MetJ family transcriptional regulator